VIKVGNSNEAPHVIIHMKALGRLSSRPVRRAVRGSERDSTGLVNDEQFGVLETGVLWDESSAPIPAAQAKARDGT
jgi:hypothetical protein